MIKPERLAHLCVEQVFLYPWMYYTSWFELHRSQDERFSDHQTVGGVPVMITVIL